MRDTSVTLGSIPYIIRPNKNKNLSLDQQENDIKYLYKYLQERLMPGLSEEVLNSTMKNYFKSILRIVTNYRNPAAHRNYLKKMEAKGCQDFIVYSEKVLAKMLSSFAY